MKYQHIFFDLDGTLTDSADGIVNSVRYALEKQGIVPPAREQLLPFVGPAAAGFVPQILRNGPGTGHAGDQSVPGIFYRPGLEGEFRL